MPSAFISYNHQDQLKAKWLAKFLQKSNVRIWLDDTDLKIGYSLIREISTAIEKTDFVLALLSKNSINSKWVKKELEMAVSKSVDEGSFSVLPIMIDDCIPPLYLKHLLRADLSSQDKFRTELSRIAATMGVKPSSWPDLQLMYSGSHWQCILMIQTFADRPEWRGPAYHCVNPKRRLKRVLKVYGGYRHPISADQASKHIENTVTNILRLDPDILGLGGKGDTASKIESMLIDSGFLGKSDYWGGDVGIDACKFLERYGVKQDK